MEIRAELTATVWKVIATDGGTVTEGDELLILESMKMEIPVVAPISGTFSGLRVSEQDQVSEGDVLGVIT